MCHFQTKAFRFCVRNCNSLFPGSAIDEAYDHMESWSAWVPKCLWPAEPCYQILLVANKLCMQQMRSWNWLLWHCYWASADWYWHFSSIYFYSLTAYLIKIRVLPSPLPSYLTSETAWCSVGLCIPTLQMPFPRVCEFFSSQGVPINLYP